MSSNQRKPLSLLIHERAGSLSPADRQLADVILSFPGEIASYTAVELAKMAGISNAAVSRFVQKLGFRSYEDMKRHARDLRSEGAPNYLLEKGPTDTVGQIARHVHFGQQNIAETFSGLDPTALAAATQGIASAEKIVFVGVRNGHFLAKYLRWQISLVCLNTVLLPSDGETIAESLSSLTERDVVVVFAIRRLVPLIRATLALLPQLRARSLLIVDQHYREPLQPTWLLRCVTHSPSPSTTMRPYCCCATSWPTKCCGYAAMLAGIA
ncbi:MurR/RpiR family transcriptional regulator [Rhizobium sp. 9140]|uniref:MurR/RpiR family transcriptional regulator n=1 Tax=Rhizobium sp. 9140 TaxID=1761900 RepID=UPI0007962ED0|nr:MurR/RpiR family transcriptional regulator [Rhizobium sp. 9140]CZT38088.1 transcriptional regulator, RpiR family [Rhizobium sp. 9140]